MNIPAPPSHLERDTEGEKTSAAFATGLNYVIFMEWKVPIYLPS